MAIYLLVLVITLLVFQPLKSNKKVGSSEDEIEGEFCYFCCKFNIFSQLKQNVGNNNNNNFIVLFRLEINELK